MLLVENSPGHLLLFKHDHLEGMHMHIQQSLTVTRCRYSSFHCTPREMPLSTIIWPITSHRFSVYRSLGTFPIKLIQQFFLIPQLGIGGSLILRTRNAYLLDTGCKLVTKFNGTYHASLPSQTLADPTPQIPVRMPNVI